MNFSSVFHFFHSSSSCTHFFNRQNTSGDLFPPLSPRSRLSRCWNRHLLLAIFSIFGSILLHSTAYAQTDGRFSIFLDTNRLPLTSDGLSLTTNGSLQLGTFTNSTNSLDVINLIRGKTNRSEIIATLSSNFVVLFSTNRIANVVVSSNILTFPTNLTIGGTARSNDIPAYVLVFNSTNPDSATEMGIFRARSTSTNSFTNAFFPSNNIRGRAVLSDGDLTTTNNTSLKLGMGTLFGQARSGSLRLAPIGPPEQMTQTRVEAFVGLDSQIPLLANNGPTSFSVVVSNSGVTSSLSTLGLTNSSGVLVGTPLTNAAGTNTLIVTATNGDGFAGNVVAPLSLVVRAQNGPNFTNAPVWSNTAGVASSFAFLTDASNPSSLIFTNLDPLPQGLVVSSSGILTGTNLAEGTNSFRILVTDTNTGDLRALNFQLISASPQIFIQGTNSSGELELLAGSVPFSKALTYTPGYSPQSITNVSGGAFAGLNVVTNSLGGTSAPVAMLLTDSALTNTIRATNTAGVRAEALVRIVWVNSSPAFDTNAFTWILGETTNQRVRATGDPSFSCSDLPPVATGISTDGTITITTSPAVLTNVTQAVWTSRIVANNLGGLYRGGGSTTSPFVITLTNPIPSITSTNRILLSSGKAASYALTVSGNPMAMGFSNAPPPGMNINGSVIEGIPTTVGTYSNIAWAYNYGSPGDPTTKQPASLDLKLYVAANRPSKSTSFSTPNNLVLSNALAPGGAPFVDTSAGINVAAYGLPPGLSIDRTTGNLSGTPTALGTYTATVFLQNAKGWIKKTVQLTVRAQ
jgi:hypothetical protein